MVLLCCLRIRFCVVFAQSFFNLLHHLRLLPFQLRCGLKTEKMAIHKRPEETKKQSTDQLRA